LTIRPASASTLTSPSVEDAILPAFDELLDEAVDPRHEPSIVALEIVLVGDTRRQHVGYDDGHPAAASACAVELPMPIGLPHPVISATRAELGIGPSFFASSIAATEE